MMRSLYAGVSGLRNHQLKMDVIGNNISNVNTIGYKSSRANFQDVLSQTLQGASSSTDVRGGTNPVQVGLGVGIGSIDTVFTDGSFQPTGKDTDLSIGGQGFFVVSDGSSDSYTRAGNFDFDSQGDFIIPNSGYKVMGWMATNGVVNANQAVKPIKIPIGTSLPATVTDKITFSNNLNAGSNTGDSVAVSITVYDKQGGAHKLSGNFTKSATANTWTFDPAATTDTGAAVTAATATISFDTNGKLTSATDPYQITIAPTTGADPFIIDKIDFSALTQYNNTSTAKIDSQNGYASGNLDTITINQEGVIVGRFSNGQTQDLAAVALATFNNPGGLTKSGGSMFQRSNNSGEPEVGTAGSGSRGKLNPGSLEMSNVDLAEQFSDMIVTQRGYQANSKIISVADEMLEELANLKR